MSIIKIKRKEKIAKQKTRLHKSKSKNKAHHLRLMLPVALIVIMVILVFLRPVFIGYFALENVSSYTQDINAVFVEDTNYLLELEQGELKSLKINGQLIGDGSAKVYLETDDETYLVFDSSALEGEGIIGITGFAVGEFNETIAINETIPADETVLMNETVATNESEQVGLSEPSERMSHNLSNGFPFAVNQTPEPDTSPPNPITSLQVVNKTGVVVLSWTNPDDTDFAGVKALRKEDVYPNINYSKAMADSLVVDITDKINSLTTLLDNAVTANITYYYRVYPYDNSFNYASGRGVLATVEGIELNETAVANESEQVGLSERSERMSHNLSNGFPFALNETIPTLTNETAPVNESLNDTEQLNETILTNEFTYLNETVENLTNPPENAEILIELEYNDGTEFDIDNNGIEAKGGIVDFKIKNTEFNWAVNKSNLCTKWETESLDNETSVTVCYGNEICCNFIGLEPLTANWDEVFYSYYSRYGASSKNKISAQVVYVDYSISKENPYSYVYYSDWASLNAVFLDEEEKVTQFNDVCVETCFLSLNETSYRLRIKLENATLRLDNISYAVIPLKAEIVNNAPELLMDIPDITIAKNNEFSIDLSKYFLDKDNDSLQYVVYEMKDISVLIDESIATFTPKKGFTGIRHSFFIANDSRAIAVSNVFKVNVTTEAVKNITVENVTIFNVSEIPMQLAAEINKPVKWVKIVSAENNESVVKAVNVSFSIPEKAFNLAVKDIKLDKVINKNKILVKDKAKSKDDKPKAEGIFGAASIEPTEEPEAEEKELEFEDGFEINETKEYIVEYETSAPFAVETNVSTYKKQIIVGSDIHYADVLAYTDVPVEAKADSIKLYWIRNNTRELFTDISYYDLNNNSLIDRIEWIIPGLSNQTFEVEITILNVQSYPTVGGNWTVRFETLGTANLTITAVDGTSWTDYSDSGNDLKFLEIKCGNQTLNYVWLNNTPQNSSVFIENYSCNETGYEISKVLTSGKHHLEFKFGENKAYAHNYANNAPVMQNASIKPDIAYTHNTLNGYCNATDADGNNVTYYWRWYNNTNLFSSGKITEGGIILKGNLAETTSTISSVFADDDYVYVTYSIYVQVYYRNNFSLKQELHDAWFLNSVFADEDYIYAGGTTYIEGHGEFMIYYKNNLSLKQKLLYAEDSINSVFADDDYVYAGGRDKKVQVYYRNNFSLKQNLTEAGNGINSVFADADYVYVGGDDYKVQVYYRNNFSLKQNLTGAGDKIKSVFADADYVYVGSFYEKTRVYYRNNFSLKQELTKEGSFVNSVFADADYVYVGGFDEKVQVYYKNNFSLKQELTGAGSNIKSVFADAYYVYVGGEDQKVQIYDKFRYFTQGLEVNANNLPASETNTGDNWIFSCQANDKKDNSSWLNSSQKTISHYPGPSVIANAISPSTIYTDTDFKLNLTITDPNNSTVVSYVQFYVNDMATSSVQSQAVDNNTNKLVGTLGSGNFSKESTLVAEFWSGDGELNFTKENTSTIRVQNTNPVMQSASIKPIVAYSNTMVRGYCNATDMDEESVTYHWKWYNSSNLFFLGNSGTIKEGEITFKQNLTESGGWIVSMFADDDYVYAGGEDYKVQVYYRNNFSLKQNLTEAGSIIKSVFADDDYVYSGGNDDKVQVYYRNNFSLKQELSEAEYDVNSVFADDDYVYAGGNDDKVQVYYRNNFSLKQNLTEAGSIIKSVFADDDYVYVCSGDYKVQVYYRNNFSFKQELTEANLWVYSVFADDDYVYVGGWSGIQVYYRNNFSLKQNLTEAGSSVRSVFADADYVYAGGDDYKVQVYYRNNFSLKQNLTEAGDDIYSVFAGDDYIYAGGDNKIQIYDKRKYYTQGLEVNLNNLSNTTTNIGDIWTFSCLADDGEYQSDWLNSLKLNILSWGPVITTNVTSPETVYQNTDWKLNLTITDPNEGDTLTAYTEFYVNGSSLDSVYSLNVTNGTNTNAANLSSSEFGKGATLIAEYWAGDGTVNTTKENTSTVTVQPKYLNR